MYKANPKILEKDVRQCFRQRENYYTGHKNYN